MATSTFVSRGRRGTWRHEPPLLRGRRGTYGAGLALVARLGPFWSPVTPRHFAWQGCTWRHPPSFHVAGVALGDIRFAWQEWHLVTSTFVLRGRRGTWRHPLAFCVAKLGLGYCRSAWQNWDLVTATCVLRGRRHLAQPLCLSHTSFTHHLCQTLSFTQLCHTPSFTHNIVTHHLSHTTFSHTIFHTTCHPQLCHTPFVTHHLSHTTLSHTIFHPQRCHTLSFTQFCHTPSFTQNLSPTTLSHTQLVTRLYARDDYQPQGMQKEFAKFADALERVQNITLVSGSMVSTPSL